MFIFDLDNWKVWLSWLGISVFVIAGLKSWNTLTQNESPPDLDTVWYVPIWLCSLRRRQELGGWREARWQELLHWGRFSTIPPSSSKENWITWSEALWCHPWCQWTGSCHPRWWITCLKNQTCQSPGWISLPSTSSGGAIMGCQVCHFRLLSTDVLYMWLFSLLLQVTILLELYADSPPPLLLRSWCHIFLLRRQDFFCVFACFYQMPNWQASRMAKLFPSTDDIDLFSGLISEKPLSGAMVGPTLACIVGLQFRHLRQCDR